MQATLGYLNKVLGFASESKFIIPRHVTISKLYNHVQAYTPQGRVNVRVPLFKYKVGLKPGMFAATKKPFNFRPKVKKQKR